MPEWLHPVFFFSGAVVMSIALARAVAFLPLLRPRSSYRLWLVLTVLMAVFLIAYIAAGAVASVGRYEILAGLTSTIFAAGALFVLFTVYLTTHLNSDLMESSRRRELLIRELQVKNDELEGFGYAAAHDLKSPLVTIKGFTGLVAADVEAGRLEEVQHGLAQIGTAADRMQRLVAELLELSLAGQVVDASGVFNVEALVREAAERIALQLSNGRVALEVEADLPDVAVDGGRLVTVFQNLLENSVKFMGRQPDPRIEVTARRDGGMVLCSVADNGKGIESLDPQEIFALFRRLDPDTEGTGIGLALAKRIVEVHGGTIWVESDGAGRGSTIRFTLPPPPAPASNGPATDSGGS